MRDMRRIGIALLIECVTDNRNRAVAEIRHVLTRYGGSMGEAGSVSWQFHRVAYFYFPLEGHDPDKVFELAVEAGADDVSFEDGYAEIIGAVDYFKELSDRLEAAEIEPEEAELPMVPNNEVDLNPEDTLQVMRVIESLEELEFTREIPNVSEEATKDLDERGIVRVGAKVREGDILIAEDHAEGRDRSDAGREAAARHLR